MVDLGGNESIRKWLRTHGPWRVTGKHSLVGKVFQVVGGKRWALVLMWDLEHNTAHPGRDIA